jgi:hypothetical protein
MAQSGQYTRKVIVNKVPPAFASKATLLDDPVGQKWELTLTLPQDVKAFLDYYDTEFDNQAGEGYIFLKSPWIFADGREKRRTYLLKNPK